MKMKQAFCSKSLHQTRSTASPTIPLISSILQIAFHQLNLSRTCFISLLADFNDSPIISFSTALFPACTVEADWPKKISLGILTFASSILQVKCLTLSLISSRFFCIPSMVTWNALKVSCNWMIAVLLSKYAKGEDVAFPESTMDRMAFVRWNIPDPL